MGLRLFQVSVLAFVFSTESFAQVAVLTQKEGDIRIVASRTGEKKSLKEGDVITRFDKIEVPAGGSAQFVFSNGNALQVAPDSLLMVEEYEFDKTTSIDHSIVSLQKGKARFSSANSYEGARNSAIIKTPKMQLSAKDKFNVVVDTTDEKSEALSLDGDIQVGTTVQNRKLEPLETLKKGFKIHNGESNPFDPAEPAEAVQLESAKKLEVPINKGPYDAYVRTNPTFAERYKPRALQKLHKRIEAKKRKNK